MKTGNQSNSADELERKKSASEYTQFTTRYDSETNTIWCWMSPEPRPCMNGKLIHELIQLQQQLTDTYTNQHPDTIWPFRHLVLASKIPGIYNLGGDLGLIKEYIVNKEEDKLRDYAYKATNLIHKNINNLDLPITIVSLVQGHALGAGFEAALSCDVIIAERSTKLGFPEILFNMFPGMGAYNLLARRIGTALAERIILSGKTYGAEELYDLGVIDVIAEDGEGVQTTMNYLNSHNQSHNTIRSMKKIRQIVHPITQKDLFDIVDIWLEASMQLSEKDLSKMERLLYLQADTKNTKSIQESDMSKQPRRDDWRKIKDASFPLVTHLGESVHKNRRKNKGRRQKAEETS
ncbi:MAG: crotonase/enoyl-CoA hydratase family protein [Proteobacteria bacterium]|nr:crotonase/enoyl-CoA hydratase family protein [Pseudomonadota bacterium]